MSAKNITSHAIMSPDQLVREAEIKPGAVVFDLGCGPGFFTIPSARLAGPKGKVVAVDIDPEMLSRLERQAGLFGFTNIETVKGDVNQIEKLKIKHTPDLVILGNILYYLTSHHKIIDHIAEVIPTGKHLLIVDWEREVKGVGPHPKSRVSKSEILKKCEKAGFKLIKEIGAGKMHFGLLLEKQENTE